MGAIRISEEIEGDGGEIFDAACAHGLERIIAKDWDSGYRSGRFGDWVKVKCVQSDSFMIVGYEHSMSARGGIGSLLLVARKGNDVIYVGSVGTGFKERDALQLRTMLDRLKLKMPPVTHQGNRRNLVWVQPTLIAEIEYRAWTQAACVLQRLREVQDSAAVYETE